MEGHNIEDNTITFIILVNKQALPVIGDGGTTFLLVFLKNPSS